MLQVVSLGRWLVLVSALAANSCAPRLIKDYTVREHDVVFAVQEGSGYALGDCKRAPDGKLSECKLYEVEFD